MAATSEHFPVLAPPRTREETAPLGLFISVFIVASVVYSLLSTGSMGGCAGGVTSDGGYIDSLGNPTLTEPACVMLQLHPQPYVYLVLAAIGYFALVAIRRRQAKSLPTSVMTVIGVAVMIAVAAASSAYHLVFVQDLFVGDWRNGQDLVVPFLSNVTIERTSW